MPLRESLAAVLRLVRASRGLSKEDFQGLVDPKHVYNLENARSGVTIDTLEAVASVLQVDALTLLTVAASLNQGKSHHEFLAELGIEGRLLSEMGVIQKWPAEFEEGELIPMAAGRRTSPEKIKAVQACRALGMSQKETAEEIGISASTVNRIWNRTVK